MQLSCGGWYVQMDTVFCWYCYHRVRGFWFYPTSELATEVDLVLGEDCSSSCSSVMTMMWVVFLMKKLRLGLRKTRMDRYMMYHTSCKGTLRMEWLCCWSGCQFSKKCLVFGCMSLDESI